MKKSLLRFLSALLIACLLLGPAALTEELPEAEIVGETAAEETITEETVAEEVGDIAAAPVEEAVEETEEALPEEAEDEVYIAEEEAIELFEEAPEDGEAAPEDEAEPEDEIQELDAALPMDGDALFSVYAQGLFGLNTGKLFAARHVGGDLTGEQKTLYDFLRARVAEIAAGKRASTELGTTHGYKLSWQQIYDVVLCLIADCPYDMYWYGNHMQFQKSGGKLTLLFAVSDNYAADSFHVNTAKVSKATAAANNARAIVNRYASRSDFE